jgi:hydroxymethylglutaryl-CoA lyase
MVDDLLGTIEATKVSLREVGIREALQSTDATLPTETKAELFGGLVEAGFRSLNAVAFVNPKKMPQMADAEALLRLIGERHDDLVVSGLVPNDRGLDRALTMGREGLLQAILLVFAVSQEVLVANGMTASHNALLEQIERSAAAAAEVGMDVSVFISTSFGCSIEGRIEPERVIEHAARIWAMDGVGEMVISDSTGQADPSQVLRLLTGLSTVLPVDRRITLHFHDTRGAALSNVFAALASPFEHINFDCAFGGWGGDYPFIPEAMGNVATEDLVEMLVGMGFDLGIDVERVMQVSRAYEELSGRPMGAKLPAASPIAWKRERNAARGATA